MESFWNASFSSFIKVDKKWLTGDVKMCEEVCGRLFSNAAGVAPDSRVAPENAKMEAELQLLYNKL